VSYIGVAYRFIRAIPDKTIGRFSHKVTIFPAVSSGLLLRGIKLS
jgi:hypothetical protein